MGIRPACSEHGLRSEPDTTVDLRSRQWGSGASYCHSRVTISLPSRHENSPASTAPRISCFRGTCTSQLEPASAARSVCSPVTSSSPNHHRLDDRGDQSSRHRRRTRRKSRDRSGTHLRQRRHHRHLTRRRIMPCVARRCWHQLGRGAHRTTVEHRAPGARTPRGTSCTTSSSVMD